MSLLDNATVAWVAPLSADQVAYLSDSSRLDRTRAAQCFADGEGCMAN